MKKQGLFIILFFSLTYAHSQCKTEKDDFTNEIVTKFEWADWNTGKLTVSLEFKKDDGNLTLGYLYKGKLETIIPKGAEVLFKLGNGEILKFQIKTDAIPKYFKTDGISSKYDYFFPVTKSDIENILNHKIDKIRLTDPSKPEGTIDTEFFNKPLKKGAECLFNK